MVSDARRLLPMWCIPSITGAGGGGGRGGRVLLARGPATPPTVARGASYGARRYELL